MGGGLGTLRSVILEHLGFDNNREPIGAYDEVGQVSAPNVSGRRLALLVTATLRNPGGTPVAMQAPNGDGIPAAGSAVPVLSYGYVYNPVTGNWDRPRGTANIYGKGANGIQAVNGSTTIWTPAAGKKFRLMGYLIVLSARATLAVAADFNLFFTDGGVTTSMSHNLSAPAATAASAGGTVIPVNLGNGYLSTAANNVLALQGNAVAALTAGTVSVHAWGTEE